jgi:hypothetical protein
MAVKNRSRGVWWSRFHFVIRFLGLTGLLVGGVALAAAFVLGLIPPMTSWNDAREAGVNLYEKALTPAGDETVLWTTRLLLIGTAAAVVAVLFEILQTLRTTAGRRSAFGFNVVVQTVLAVALLVGLNFWEFEHPLRFDWTRDRQFTLAPKLADELRQLKGETTVVVYQRHKTAGALSEKPDAYDFAAERKVVEKVKDLVDQLREFGSRFRVEVLDVEEEGYNDKLAALTEHAKDLRDAIEAAPENSIFFYSPGKQGSNNESGRLAPRGAVPASRSEAATLAGSVQRLSFNEFYQLDKAASQKANDGNGNLVLLKQGVEPFARKVLNIDEKRPVVGVLVIHEVLTTQGPEYLGLAGMKKALASRGFEVRDIILKKWSELGPPEPTVTTFDESKLERLEEDLASLDAEIKAMEEESKALHEMQKDWKSAPLAELTKKYAKQLDGVQVTERIRQLNLPRIEQNVVLLDFALKQYREERDETAKQKAGINVENAAEQRRMTDVKAKLARSLAECDLIFIPRMTLINVNLSDRIPNRLYRLGDAQVAAIKDYMKGGKPVLACFGPPNDPPNERPDMTGPTGPDEMEKVLGDLGIRFGKQTVLFNAESKSFAERRSGLIVGSGNVEVPPVEFDWKSDALLASNQLASRERPRPEQPNPIREAMQITAHSQGKDLDIRVRHPRPIYFEGSKDAPPLFDPVFMVTSAASWNDDQPFPGRERTPRFEPGKDDPNKGTVDEKRRGPFPIGVAIETKTPAAWYAEGAGKPTSIRVAAIGHGGLFVGTELSPAKETLLLNTCNWLLGRDDRLPQAEQVWQYPRVALTSQAHWLWRWGGWLALPIGFAYLGLVVLLVRRLR